MYSRNRQYAPNRAPGGGLATKSRFGGLPSRSAGGIYGGAPGRTPVSRTDILLFQQLANPKRAIIPESTSKLMREVQTAAAATAGESNGPLVAPTSFPARGYHSRMSSPPASAAAAPAPAGRKFQDITARKKKSSVESSYKRNYRNDDYDDGDDTSSDPYSDSSDNSMSDSDNSMLAGSIASSDDYEGGGEGHNMLRINPDNSDGEDYNSESDVASEDASAAAANGGGDMRLGGGGGRPSYPEQSQYSLPMPSTDIYDSASEMQQRQFYIQELMRFKQEGQVLSIEVSEETPTAALRSEVETIQESLDSAEGVNRLFTMLTFGMLAIEAINRHVLRGTLPLDNWTQHVTTNERSTFIVPLRRIHNMYFRNSFGHPIMQLVSALFFSAIPYMVMQDTSLLSNIFGGLSGMFGGKGGGGSGNATTAPSAAAAAATFNNKSPAPFASAAAPHHQQQQQQPQSSASAAGSTPAAAVFGAGAMPPPRFSTGNMAPHGSVSATTQPRYAAKTPAQPRVVKPPGGSGANPAAANYGTPVPPGVTFPSL